MLCVSSKEEYPSCQNKKEVIIMLKCAACNAPLVTMEVANTDLRCILHCSCGNVNEVHGFRGKLTVRLAHTYRHPDFIKGTDEERYQTLRAGLLELQSTVSRLTELKQDMKREKDRLWKTVQNQLVNRHRSRDVIETLGQEELLKQLAETFGASAIEEMLRKAKSNG